MTVYLVTDDAAMLSGDPKRLHPTDLAMLVGRTAVSTARFHELAESVLRDEVTLQQATDEPGLHGAFPVKPGELKTLVKAANETSKDFLFVAHAIMTRTMADFVRVLRVERGQSWRSIASEFFERQALTQQQRKVWWPPANQLMGMALCEVAAKEFGEDYLQPPWN